MIPEWITLSKTSGSGNSQVTVTCTKNTQPIGRTSTIAVTSGDKTVNVQIQQEAAQGDWLKIVFNRKTMYHEDTAPLSECVKYYDGDTETSYSGLYNLCKYGMSSRAGVQVQWNYLGGVNICNYEFISNEQNPILRLRTVTTDKMTTPQNMWDIWNALFYRGSPVTALEIKQSGLEIYTLSTDATTPSGIPVIENTNGKPVMGSGFTTSKIPYTAVYGSSQNGYQYMYYVDTSGAVTTLYPKWWLSPNADKTGWDIQFDYIFNTNNDAGDNWAGLNSNNEYYRYTISGSTGSLTYGGGTSFPQNPEEYYNFKNQSTRPVS